MAASNSNRLLLIGVLVFVVGVVLVLLVFWGLGGDDDPTSLVTESPTGTAQPEPQPTFTGPIQRLPVPMEIPSDREGVAIAMGSVRGLLAVPNPGDIVNIYELPSVTTFLLEDPLDPVSPPVLPDRAALLMEQIEVLGVVGAPGAAEVSFIISIEPNDVAELLPLIEARQLWFTLLPQPEETPTAEAAA